MTEMMTRMATCRFAAATMMMMAMQGFDTRVGGMTLAAVIFLFFFTPISQLPALATTDDAIPFIIAHRAFATIRLLQHDDKALAARPATEMFEEAAARFRRKKYFSTRSTRYFAINKAARLHTARHFAHKIYSVTPRMPANSRHDAQTSFTLDAPIDLSLFLAASGQLSDTARRHGSLLLIVI